MLLDRNDGVLLVVDVQERLVSAMHDFAAARKGIETLIRSAVALDVPVLFTEQDPKGLGPTAPDPAARARDAPVVPKVRFSAVGEPALLDHLEGIGRRT